MSPELCKELPELNQYGFYRKLNNGKLEFVSFCKPEAKRFFAIHETRFNELLNELLPEKKKSK